MHDFNPGITPNGLFWIVQVADDAVKISDEGNTLTLHLANVPVVDQGFFPGGTGTAPATVSFDIVYKKVEGTRRTVRPSTRDRLSPFNWAGKMWRATNSGTFSVSYNDKTFSATGSFMTDTTNPDTTGFGEMGLERNGSFVKDEDFKAADAAAHSAAGDRSAGAAAVETQSAGVRPGPYRTSVLVNQLHQ